MAVQINYFAKRFEEETNLRCILVIDNSSSMYYPVREKPSSTNPIRLLFLFMLQQP